MRTKRTVPPVSGRFSSRLSFWVPPRLIGAVDHAERDWSRNEGTRRLWEGDASLWTSRDEGSWLGWLHLPRDSRAHTSRLEIWAKEIRDRMYRSVLLLGMGGSALTPDVFSRTFRPRKGFPRLHVLDSTHPDQILRFERKMGRGPTLFIVASKSGATIEPNLLMDYFQGRPARDFVAITDPGSPLDVEAGRRGFGAVFHGAPGVGGRFSALSDFGLAPAAAMGLDVGRLLQSAESMATHCGPDRRPEHNPGVYLGLILGALALKGFDKLTMICDRRIGSFGGWVEQMVAESTGKDGTGIIPVDGETTARPSAYGRDRVFVCVGMGTFFRRVEPRLRALDRAGHPVVLITLNDPYDLGGEFFRWEMATAVAGSLLKINPFNQPDVESAKAAARKLLEISSSSRLPIEMRTSPSPRIGVRATPQGRIRSSRRRPAGASLDSRSRIGVRDKLHGNDGMGTVDLGLTHLLIEEGGLRLFADPRYVPTLWRQSAGRETLTAFIRSHLTTLRKTDHFSILSYLEMSDASARPLQKIRHLIRDRFRVATSLGFGPRYLHSTGQAFKGGPNTGVFVQVTADPIRDLPVPGRGRTFGTVLSAQAAGDFQVLAERGRRIIRIDLAAAGLKGLDRLVRLFRRAGP